MTKKLALVTGGMGGIGHAICRELHSKGMRVIAGYSRTQEAALAWLQDQQKDGFQFDIAYADIANFDSCSSMIKKIEEELGPIDILVNNAGITRDHTCSKMTQE